MSERKPSLEQLGTLHNKDKLSPLFTDDPQQIIIN